MQVNLRLRKSVPSKHRNYKQAAKYEDSPKQVKNREARNEARGIMTRLGKVTKGDKKDVDHIKPLSEGGSTIEQNLRVLKEHDNRSFQRGKNHEWVGPAKSIAAEHINKGVK